MSDPFFDMETKQVKQMKKEIKRPLHITTVAALKNNGWKNNTLSTMTAFWIEDRNAYSMEVLEEEYEMSNE
ncbi:hypothetical protein CON64_14055 [Bacillus pseudomycoides]|nr:hypothetical protein CON64_14055 [Bacillus pseudomycoides]